MKKITFISLVLFSITTSASKFSHFSSQLEERLLIDLTHLERVEQNIKIRKPNVLERWWMNKSGAEATYNDKTNVVVLREKNFRGKRIVARDDFAGNQKYSFIVLASTIFHEMAHADYDTVISREGNSIKDVLWNIGGWFKSNTKHNPKIGAHEFFGYSAGDILIGLDGEVSDILLQHRIHPQTLECFARGSEFDEFQLRTKKDYVKAFTPDYVFIKGKSVDLKKLNFPNHFRKKVYDYFSKRYNFPFNREELINILNRSKYLDILKSCKTTN
jgi:hypothetical protein